jgi:ABC-type branched-subunit amino acid transport system ATPase component
VSRGGDPAGAVSLELIGLQRRFGPVIALGGLTIGVPPGQVFGFLGPNGAGKTTAMRARGRHDMDGADRGADLRPVHPAHRLARAPA